MKSLHYHISALALIVLALNAGYAQQQSPKEKTWTFTYLKATEGQKERLKTYLKKNWFTMDSIAVAQKLINGYELLENVSDGTPEWDFIVAVEYFTRTTYADIEAPFEAIRKQHRTIPVDGLTLKDLGKIVKSETLQKR